MSVHPLVLPTSPEGSVWDAVSDLRREGRATREGRAAQVQRAASVGNPGQVASGATGLTTLATCALNVPSTDSLIEYFFFITDLHVSVGTTTVEIDLLETTDLPLGQGLLTATNTGLSEALPSFTPNAATAGQVWSTNLPTTLTLKPGSYTAGDKTYQLCARRVAGAGTWTATGVSLWMAIF